MKNLTFFAQENFLYYEMRPDKMKNKHFLTIKVEMFQPWYRIHVSEDAKVGTVLLQIAATDEDSGEGGRIGYR